MWWAITAVDDELPIRREAESAAGVDAGKAAAAAVGSLAKADGASQFNSESAATDCERGFPPPGHPRLAHHHPSHPD